MCLKETCRQIYVYVCFSVLFIHANLEHPKCLKIGILKVNVPEHSASEKCVTTQGDVSNPHKVDTAMQKQVTSQCHRGLSVHPPPSEGIDRTDLKAETREPDMINTS